jgi:hypothetical protein
MPQELLGEVGDITRCVLGGRREELTHDACRRTVNFEVDVAQVEARLNKALRCKTYAKKPSINGPTRSQKQQ